MNSIFKKNEELENRFLKDYTTKAAHVLCGDKEEGGVLHNNGVLCLFNDGYTVYAEDNFNNRILAMGEWGQLMAEYDGEVVEEFDEFAE